MNRLTKSEIANEKSENKVVLEIVYEKFTLPCDAAMLE